MAALSDDLEITPLPDGRVELTWGKCIPVIMTADLHASKSALEVMKLVAELTLNAHDLVEKHGYDLPLTTGKFVPDEDVAEGYLLRAPEQAGYAMRVLLQAHAPPH